MVGMTNNEHPHTKRRPESAAVRLGVEIYREEGDIEPLRHSLSARQRAFCEEYVHDFNATAAAVRAGYAPKWADRQAYNLRHHTGCAAFIDYLGGSKAAKVTVVDPDYVISRITAIINKMDAKDGDKLRGLELIARHLGMLTDKIESKTTIDIVQKQKIEEDAQDFIANLKAIKPPVEKDIEIL